MKIAMIGQKGIPGICGGIEKHVEEIAIRIASSDTEVTVFNRKSYCSEQTKDFNGVDLVCIPNIPTKHLDAISYAALATMKIAFDRKIDIAHFHGIGPSLLLPILRLLRPHIPIVCTFHSQDYLHGKWNLFGKFALYLGEWFQVNLADKLIAVSQENCTYLKHRYQKDVEYLPNGVSINPLVGGDVIKQFDLDEQGYILVVGRLVPVKCIHDIVAAYKKLHTKKKLVIAGESSYTDKYAMYLKKISKDVPGIRFIGFQSQQNLAQLYKNCFMYIQASSTEGLSFSLLEAMSYGCPVLVSDIRANTDVVCDAGFSFTQGDVADLTYMLKKILEDESLLKPFRQKAIEQVKERYNWDYICPRLLSIYSDLMP